MPTLNCYVDDDTLETLRAASENLGRSVEQLAESAISEEACRWRRDHETKERGS